MDGANMTEGGDGDSAAKEANSHDNAKSADAEDEQLADALDVERAHHENAKRCKLTPENEDVANALELDSIGTAIDDKTVLNANVSVASGSTSSYYEASTSSSDNSTSNATVKGGKKMPKKRTIDTNALSRTLDSDDDPDVPSSDPPESPAPAEVPPPTRAGETFARWSSLSSLQSDDAEQSWDASMFQEMVTVVSQSMMSDEDGDVDVEDVDLDEDTYAMSLRLTDSDSDSDTKPTVLEKAKPKHNWFIVPEIQNRQFGASAKQQAAVHFQQRCSGSLHCVERLELMYKLEKHTGCVNSINFHPNGTLLASGSDDLEIVIWDWKLGNPLLSFESKHKNNVFQSKFLPLHGDDLHIVSCARDGQVRLAQVSQEGLRSTRKLGLHLGPSHKLAVLNDQPQVVLSVGEDGLVLRHDLRSPKSEKITVVRDETLLITIPLYSISSNPLNSNEYCVTGKDYRVRSYDLRKSAQALALYHPFEKVGEKHKQMHITCAVYNHNGSEIVASYSEDDLYLFDANSKEGTYAHSYQGHRNSATIKGVNFFGPKSEFVISGSDCGHVFFWEKDSEAIVQFLRADDNGIVNCLEPHPQLPFLCTSGLDSDIKVWVPSYEENPPLTDLAETVKLNYKHPARWSSASAYETENARVLWMLWRQFNTMERIENMRRDTDPPASADDFMVGPSSDDTGSMSSSSSDSDDSGSISSESNDGPGRCATS